MADDSIRLLQDRALVDRARGGGATAFEELYRRHARAAWRMALAVTPQPDVAGTAVVSGFASTLAGPGLPPVLARGMRTPLLTATRHAALDAVGRPVRAVRPTPSVAATGSSAAVADAFGALPELWRSALWLADVDGLSLADTAAVLELAPTAAASLLERARLGLRQQVLLPGRDVANGPSCRRTLDRLAGYATGTLVDRDARRARAHLDECGPCRERLALLDDLPLRLRAGVPLLPVALGPAALRRWYASLHHDTGPFGLTLPGGKPVPPWIERALAGTAAAAIALGVTGAILAGGRSRARTDDRVRDATATVPFDAGDGEVALGGADGMSDLVVDVVGRAPSTPPVSTGPEDAAPAAAALPRSGGPAPSTAVTGGPGVGAPDPGPDTADPPPPPAGPGTPPPPSDPAAQITVGVGDAVAVTVGADCTGVELLGTVIGCPPPESDAPLTLDTGTVLPGLPLGL